MLHGNFYSFSFSVPFENAFENNFHGSKYRENIKHQLQTKCYVLKFVNRARMHGLI